MATKPRSRGNRAPRQNAPAPRDAVVNLAAAYDVGVAPANAQAGQLCWRAVSVRHLPPEENQGKHNIYVDIQDENGNPIRDPNLRIGWTWEGRRDDEQAPPKPLDKPAGEPAGNVDVFSGQHVQVWIEGDGNQSDHVVNLHTGHPDEPGPTGQLWNSIGHHSFHIVFRRMGAAVSAQTAPAANGGQATIPAPAPVPVPTPAPAPAPVPAPAPTPPAPVNPAAGPFPEYIFGLHESGGEQHMIGAGRKGWVLELAAIGLDGNQGNADFRGIAQQGLGVVVRINHGYGSTGTLPLPQEYAAFAQACRTYVARSAGCAIWVIGNEPNHESERPNGQPIVPADYVRAYTLCREAIHSAAGHAKDLVLVAGPAPWNTQTKYPGNEAGDWVKYLADTLVLLADNGCDGIALHTYTHELNPEQISGDFRHGAAGYTHLRNEFRTYRDFMGAIPPRFRHLPVLITETDPTDPGQGWRDGRNVGWVRAAYREIAEWNSDPANQPIQALILYRWPDPALHGQREWSIANRPGIIEDFVQALTLEPSARFRLRAPGAPAAVQPIPGAGPAPTPTPAPALDVPLPAICTNQQVIDAFFFAARDLGAADYRELLARAGLNVDALAGNREAIYSGPAVSALPGLNAQEKATVRRELLAQLLRFVRWVGLVNAPAGLNLRAAPSSQQAVLTVLAHETTVQVLGEEGEWLYVAADGKDGYVSRQHVLARIESATGTVMASAAAAPAAAAVAIQPASEAALAPAASQMLAAPAGADARTQSVVRTWNRYGALVQTEADRLDIDPGVAVAVLVAESAGAAFGADGRMVIRFENHIFHQFWGKENPDRFSRHFRFDPGETWKGHEWRPDPNGAWQPCHANQAGEWQILEFARQLNEEAALKSISMGAPQVMGFNHATIGYASAREMFDAFRASASNQLASMFRFVEVNGLTEAMRRGDYEAFAGVYNGPGQKSFYAGLIRDYTAAFQAAAAAAPAGTGPRGAAQGRPRLPQPAAASGKSLQEADPELYAVWRSYMEQGFANNQTMFDQVLKSFMHPYRMTIWMYAILFGLGVASFIAAIAISYYTEQVGFAVVFGGLSAVTMLSYFFNRPLQALEENLQFITWLGIIYNTYWTRLLYIQDQATVQTELEDATNDAIRKIKELMQEHTLRSGNRPGLR